MMKRGRTHGHFLDIADGSMGEQIAGQEMKFGRWDVFGTTGLVSMQWLIW